MAGRVRVFAGVAIRRTVATKSHAAFLAGPQVDPIAADLHALLAFKTVRPLDRFDSFDVGAFSGNHLMSVRPEMSYGYGRKSSAAWRGQDTKWSLTMPVACIRA